MTHAIAYYFERLAPKKRIDPKQIVNRIVSVARRERRRWGGKYKPNVLNEYIIRTNRADWDAYYHVNRKSICETLASVSAKRLEDRQLKYLPPLKTTLVLDASLDDRTFLVEALFERRVNNDIAVGCETGTASAGEVVEQFVSTLKSKIHSSEEELSMREALAETAALRQRNDNAAIAFQDGGAYRHSSGRYDRSSTTSQREGAQHHSRRNRLWVLLANPGCVPIGRRRVVL